MKEVVLSIEDSVFEKFLGVVDICSGVTVISEGDCINIKDVVDIFFSSAIKEMIDNKSFKSPSDYTYIFQFVSHCAWHRVM
jgi:hypothetical protein